MTNCSLTLTGLERKIMNARGGDTGGNFDGGDTGGN